MVPLTILDEKSQLSQDVAQDLEQMHNFLKQVAGKLDLELPPLRSSFATTEVSKDESPSQPNKDHHVPSRDTSPKPLPEDDDLPYAPIHSLYTLTKLRALRSPDDLNSQQNQGIDDVITRRLISLSDAERLFEFYRKRLDPYIYLIGCPYESMQELRQKSQFLLVAVLTVAALHDSTADHLYPICTSEFKRLFETSIFERRLSRDYLRALCIGCYWLSDLSWMLSGHAIRRAAEFDLHNSYDRAIEKSSTEDAECARIWYILCVCDQQLATQYGRPSIVQEDASTQGAIDFLHSAVSNEEDRRLLSQATVVSILRSIRELFSGNKGKPIPRLHLNHISHFRIQLDQWFAFWTDQVQEIWPGIGGFPRKGIILHYNFAQLYLYSHVFRGISKDDHIPHYFLDCALNGIKAATTIIDKFLNDPDITSGIVGMPSYVHSMTAFASMFLTKVATKYHDLIERDKVYDLITGLVQQFRSQPAGKWHLANLMTSGLERMAQTLKPDVPVDMGLPLGVGMNQSVDAGISGVDNFFPDLAGDFFFNYDMSFDMNAPL
ncbi:transcriptional activator of proteases prtt [Fusarium flagelliforme]|uniref:Transcriptional activator of proteases prtt n=1 Tax=Fusarium flagelliforme TaxID=2675880 RepID=A0A395MSF9_9HYPO|nr:transcriptional activator of proteases prtt [Fusarium flagelliforme]